MRQRSNIDAIRTRWLTPSSQRWLLLVILLLAWAGRGFPLWALEAQVILHFSLASVFTYLFVRRLSRSRFAAVVSALTFTYSGYLTSFPVQQVSPESVTR